MFSPKDTGWSKKRVTALNIAIDQKLDCDTLLQIKTVEAINNLNRYRSAQQRLDTSDKIRNNFAFDLNASQRDNTNLSAENKNLKTGIKNMWWPLGGSIVLNVLMFLMLIR